jgi:predicted nucleotidyltransferase
MVEDLMRRINEEYERKFSNFLEKLISAYPDSTIVLFGSRARGKNRPNSDFDIIVFVSCQNPLHKSIEIYQTTRPDFPVDIVVMKPEEVNDRNLKLTHMFYYGYKILYDGLNLKKKIERMMRENVDKLKDIIIYDDPKYKR